jgi:hypothetical protein
MVSGVGQNGIPTSEPFYGFPRAYVPASSAAMKVKFERIRRT